MKIWRLKKGADVRFRQGHPWVFSGELSHSSRDVEPGEVVELHDANDHFLAYGTAHPSSNICFRKLSGRSKETDILSVDFFLRRFEQARNLRWQAGFRDVSYRWLFGEVDGLPGLVADVFRSEDEEWVVFQVNTAGMERARAELMTAFEAFGKTSLIESSTSSHRKVEGLTPTQRSLTEAPKTFALKLMHLDTTIALRADLAGGQKTGFFLDQQWNTNLLLRQLRSHWQEVREEIRVLDLCSYVGQWSAQMATLARTMNKGFSADLLDVSKEALALAKTNVEAQGGSAILHDKDMMEDWGLGERMYDVVICDPPAMVKKKQDLAQGLGAYVKINREALRRVKPGGLIVTCSCSGSVREEDFEHCLVQAKTKAGRNVRWLEQGGHGPDHPVLLEFPEGRYLKCRIGQVDFPF